MFTGGGGGGHAQYNGRIDRETDIDINGIILALHVLQIGQRDSHTEG